MRLIIFLLLCLSAAPAFSYRNRVIKDTTALRDESYKPLLKFLVPEGTVNIALKKRVTSSDDFPIIGQLSLVTDGDKDMTTRCVVTNESGNYSEEIQSKENWVELGPGTHWVQIDLGKRSRIYGVQIWHYYIEPRVYRDVVVQVCDENTFTQNVRTIYNNDQDETSKLGKGKDREYYESYQGFRIDTRGKNHEGILARFVRLYSRGNTTDPQNQYIEVEVIGQEGTSKAKTIKPPHPTRLMEWKTKFPEKPHW